MAWQGNSCPTITFLLQTSCPPATQAIRSAKILLTSCDFLNFLLMTQCSSRSTKTSKLCSPENRYPVQLNAATSLISKPSVLRLELKAACCHPLQGLSVACSQALSRAGGHPSLPQWCREMAPPHFPQTVLAKALRMKVQHYCEPCIFSSVDTPVCATRSKKNQALASAYMFACSSNPS